VDTRAGADPGPVPECQTELAAPRGFRLVSHQHVEYDDHLGSRLRLKAPHGRTLFYNVGIPGEFAEGADLRGVTSVLDDHEANLYGAGSVWVLTWDEGGPCGANVVIGNGFAKRVFLATLTGAGLLNPGD